MFKMNKKKCIRFRNTKELDKFCADVESFFEQVPSLNTYYPPSEDDRIAITEANIETFRPFLDRCKIKVPKNKNEIYISDVKSAIQEKTNKCIAILIAMCQSQYCYFDDEANIPVEYLLGSVIYDGRETYSFDIEDKEFSVKAVIEKGVDKTSLKKLLSNFSVSNRAFLGKSKVGTYAYIKN